ncbi:MAG: hypothetical protein IH623_22245, partial [Verrucomicrobia bacterium]|nr:hypothetical protein [Verrucomicrobiota bacterium]
YFNGQGYTNAPLRALGHLEEDPNGVFAYTADPGVFPTGGNGANYWVDPVFVQTLPPAPPAPPVLLSIEESTVTTGLFTLEWQVVVGRTYELQWKANLLDADWTLLETLAADTTVEAFTYNVDGEGVALSGFFRLLDVTP